jgi:hypothetical protein
MWHVWGRRLMHVGLWEQLKERKPHGRHRHKWENNIKMDLKGIGWKGVHLIHLAKNTDTKGTTSISLPFRWGDKWLFAAPEQPVYWVP